MASGTVRSSTVIRCGLVQAAPALEARRPRLGHFGQDVDPGTNVLAALGVVRREWRQGVRPPCLPPSIVSVHRLGADAEADRVAADLVERHQAVVDVKGRVLDPLGRHRRGHLLELAGESPLLGAVLVAEATPGIPGAACRG